MNQSPEPSRRGANRRQFLLGGAVAGLGAAVAIGADTVLRQGDPQETPESAAMFGEKTVTFYGKHQAAVTTPPAAFVTFVALTLNDDLVRDDLRRLMLLLSDDAARLMSGVAALADSEPELALRPANLTVLFGFGPRFVSIANGQPPSWLKPLPSFSIDQLLPEFSGGDLLLRVTSDDPLTVAHAVRMLLKDARGFTSVKWSQRGFRRARGTEQPDTTMRNLFGQVDGTVNMTPGTAEFDRLVWLQDGWLAGGTSLVVRRIAMDLEGWGRLDRPGREQAIGRNLTNGAPLTGTAERDEPDFNAKDPLGFPVIPDFSHLRRSRSENRDEQIFRHSFNYDEAPGAGEISNSGLIFTSFQADIDRQFVPIQQRLADLDLLNEWTTPIGSAVFAIPPGCAQGGYIGETLLS